MARNPAALLPWLGLVGLSHGCGSGLPNPEFERFDPQITPTASDLPDAPAVVLLDRGTLLLTSDPKTGNPIARLRRYRRIKVLREAGIGLAEINIPWAPLSFVHGLRGQVVHSDGRITKPSEPAKRVTDPHGAESWQLSLPHVVPGTIIETTYDVYVQDPRFIPPWFFAGPLATIRSEYAVVVPPGFAIDLRFTENGAFVDRPPERFETDRGVRFFWSRTNLRPIYPEENMPDPTRIAPAAHVIYTSATLRGRTYPGFPSWEAVGAWFLLRRPDYGQLSEATQAEARRLVANTPSMEKALKLMEVLARDLPAEDPNPAPLWKARLPHPDRVLQERRGNPTSRGLLLVSLLRASGVAALPALFTYRDAGTLAPDAPTVTLLHGVAAAIFDRDRLVLLDPSQLTVSAEVASPRLMGTRVIVLRDNTAEVHRVPMSKATQSRTQVRYDVQLDPEGQLYGPLEATLTGAEAGALRTALFSVKPEAYAETVSSFLESRGAPLPLESVNLSNLKSLRRPLKIEASIRAPLPLTGETEVVTIRVGEFVGTNAETPREVRRSPLLLGAPASHEVRGTLTLPEEWEHTELPAAGEARWKGGELTLTLRGETRRRLGFIRHAISRDLEVPTRSYRRYRRFVQELAVLEDQSVTGRRPPPGTPQH